MKRKVLYMFGIIIILIFIIYFSSFIMKLKGEKKDNEKEVEVVSYCNNPIIPEGFKSVDTDTAKWIKDNDGIIKDWNKGLVIEDEQGNQFVWVPIDLDNLNYYYNVSEDNRFNKKNLNSRDEVDRQILKYGGFYVSRYEAGISKKMQSNIINISSTTNNVLNIPVSQKDTIPWNYISFKNAKVNAESMYNNENLKSKLLTQKQYQGIMQWLNSCGYEVYNNSYSFGNYSNVIFEFSGYYSEDYGKSYKYSNKHLKAGKNMILSSGASNRNMTNNIYDLAGNLLEYVEDDESKRNNMYLCNGGYYDYIARSAYDSWSHTGEPSDKIGFRIVLMNN